QFEVHYERAAGLDPRKADLANVVHAAFAEEQQVAVPAVRLGPGGGRAGGRHRQQPVLTLEPVQIQQAFTASEAAIGLLQRNDVCADLADHVGSPIGVEAFVHADAFVDVVGRHED